jgi:hypothetical protein
VLCDTSEECPDSAGVCAIAELNSDVSHNAGQYRHRSGKCQTLSSLNRREPPNRIHSGCRLGRAKAWALGVQDAWLGLGRYLWIAMFAPSSRLLSIAGSPQPLDRSFTLFGGHLPLRLPLDRDRRYVAPMIPGSGPNQSPSPGVAVLRPGLHWRPPGLAVPPPGVEYFSAILFQPYSLASSPSCQSGADLAQPGPTLRFRGSGFPEISESLCI